MWDYILGLDPTVQVALVGIFSALISAATGAIVSRWHTASQFRDELQKLSVERLHQQGDVYLKNAREQAGRVYIPLSASLAVLKASFQGYVYQGRSVDQRKIFCDQIDVFITELQTLERRGATAYITTELEDVLIKFATFLLVSKTAKEAIVAVTYDFSFGIAGFRSTQSGSKKYRRSSVVRPRMSASISAAGVGAEFRVSDLIQAAVDSDDFQARFERDTHRLSVLIKEVTLGRPAREI